MSSLFVSALTFASTWPCGTDTAPRRMARVQLGDAGQFAVRTANGYRCAVDDARRRAVIGIDQHIGGIPEKVELGVEPPHLPSWGQDERGGRSQRGQLVDQ